MRWVIAVLSLTGCDIVMGLDERPRRPVFELESATHDEDGDGIVDRDDPCPHLAAPADNDFDNDGIGDLCDPRIDQPDLRYFIAFEGGNTGNLVRGGQIGIGPNADSIVFGDELENHSTLVLPIVASTVDIEAAVTIGKTKPLEQDEYAEIGLFSVHRAFDAKSEMRGDVCFFGTDRFGNTARPNFLEFNNDDASLDVGTRFDGSINDLRGVFRHQRTPREIHCEFATATTSYAGGGMHAEVPRELSGQIALSTHFMAVRLDYLWVVTPRP